jgi:expansin (peptidoglycan-binding protein)
VGIGFLALALVLGGTNSNSLAVFSDIASSPRIVSTAQAAKPAPPADPEPALPATIKIMVPRAMGVSPVYDGVVTHYGVTYNGYTMGCGPNPETYTSDNPTIIAVSPADAGNWPCGTSLRVCGPSGCIIGVRVDACPGCGPYHLDLSEAGIDKVCGDQGAVCKVTIEKVIWQSEIRYLPVNWEGY